MTDSAHLGEGLGEEGITAPLLATIFYPKTGPIGKVWIGETDAENQSPEVLDSATFAFIGGMRGIYLMKIARQGLMITMELEDSIADETTLCLLCAAYREADRQIRG